MGQARERDGRGRPPVWQGCRVLAEIFVMNWQSADSLTADPETLRMVWTPETAGGAGGRPAWPDRAGRQPGPKRANSITRPSPLRSSASAISRTRKTASSSADTER